MGIVAQNTGTTSGTSFTVSLGSTSAASSRVGVIYFGNTTVNTPGGFTLRTSKVSGGAIYLWDTAGGGSSWNFTNADGEGTWWVFEIANGVYNTSNSQNNDAQASTYTTTSLTPGAGTRCVIAAFGSLLPAGPVRTVSGWTNSFVEQQDFGNATADFPSQGDAARVDQVYSGAASTSTGVTYSASSFARYSIIASYGTTQVPQVASRRPNPRVIGTPIPAAVRAADW